MSESNARADNMIEWKDETSYSRGDTERVPRAWAVKVGALKISVHRHIHHDPDVWLLTCAPWFSCHELPSKAAPLAKRQALDLVQERLHAALMALGAGPGAGVDKECLTTAW
jgi:hypothetical protein